MSLPVWLRALFKRPVSLPPEVRQAKALLAAIDAGGVPLNPVRVNEIARAFGLSVSTRAPVEDTIKRIRAAVERSTW